MRHTLLIATLAISGGAVAASSAQAQATYKKDVPDSLVAHAKITEAAASVIAQKRVPKGAIDGVELEREKGKLIYSYDIRTAGKSGIDEVNIDAMTGRIVAFSHETPAMEKKEAAEDAKAAAKAAKKVKKP